ncbi:restriction endonuclease subunit S [Amycolatopsis sp. NPDC059021]|uniref:restriction endonuclease subunit S n=1 Tax=Amycolatopsis sp. NPDC059021 TaxID=3346704 RepID=UPI00366CCE7B
MTDPIRANFGQLIEDGLLEIGDGYRAKLEELGGTGPIFMRAGCMKANGFDWSEAERFNVMSVSKYQTKIGRIGDTVVTTKGNSVGRTAYVGPDIPAFVYSPHLSYWRSLDRGKIIPEFLYYWSRGEEFSRQLRALAHGTDMAPYLSLTDQRRMLISLPPPSVQRGIAFTLRALDDKIAVNDRIADSYEAIVAFHFEQLGSDIEASYGSVPASEMVEFNPKTAAPIRTDAVYLDMAALPTKTARVRNYSRRQPKPGTRFRNGDTVMARITPCLENGKTAFVDFLPEGEIGVGSTEFIVMRPRPGVPAHFPYFLARSQRFRTIAIRNMVGSSGRQRVSAAQMQDVPLVRPKTSELSKFDEVASPAFAHMKSLGQESKTLAELRDLLLPKLMSGELRVKDAERLVEDMV